MKASLFWTVRLVTCVVLPLLMFVVQGSVTEGQGTPVEQALQYVSQKYAIPASRLIAIASCKLTNEATGANATGITVTDNQTAGRIYKVVVDSYGAAIDRATYDSMLNKAYREKFGKLSPDLYDSLQRKGSEDKSRIAVWLNCDLAAVAANISAKYPQAKLAGLRPTLQTDPALYQSIKVELDDALKRAYRDSEGPITQLITSRGFSITGRAEYAPVVFAEIPKSAILDAAQQDSVDMIYDVSGNVTSTLDVAAQAVAVPRQGTFGGFTGAGVRVAVVDYEGIDFGNTDLTARDAGIRRSGIPYITYNDNPRFQGHATKTAGVIASGDEQFKGAASGVTLVSANGAFGDEDIAPAADWAISPSYGNADILNVSLGVYNDAIKGQIQFLDRYFDNVVAYHGKTVVVSAGNVDSVNTEGWIKTPGLAYNVITVGNYDDHNIPGWADDTMYSTSCFKDPPGGDRNKPEVAAPGTNIMTTSAMADPSHPITAIPGVTGTSFAAPMVTGEAARLMQQSASIKWWPEAVKAVIMASAYHDVDPASHDKDGVGGIDVQYAHEIVQNGTWSEGGFYPGGDSNTHRYLTATAGQKVKAVVCWSAHTNSQDPDFYYSHSLLDIDLEVMGPNGQLVASSASWNNNYEAVEFTAPSTGTYTIHAYYLTPIYEYEYFALAWDARTPGGPGTTPPTINTGPTTQLTWTTVTLYGNLTSLGSASTVNVYFDWGLTTSYGNTVAGLPPSMTTPGTYTASLTGLSPGTTYHFRAKAVGNGTSYGNDVAFTTLSDGSIPLNHSFELGDPPTGWNIYQDGTLASINRSTDHVSQGIYALKVISEANKWAHIAQFNPNYTAYTGKTITLSVDVWCATPNRAHIMVDDGVSGATSSYHPGDGQFHRLSVTFTLSTAITRLNTEMDINGSGGSVVAYFDDASLVVSPLTNPGFELGDPPTGWNIWQEGTSASMSRSTEHVSQGIYALKVVNEANRNAHIYQFNSNYAAYAGKTVTLSADVWSATPNRVYIDVDDGISGAVSSYHPGDGQFHRLFVTFTLSTAITRLNTEMDINGSGGSVVAYFDDVSLVVSPLTNPEFELGDPPTGWNVCQEGTLSSINRSTDHVSQGTYALKVISEANKWTHIYQFNSNYAAYAGKTVTLSADVWSATPNRVYIDVDDGISGAVSSYHPGHGQFHRLFVTFTLSTAITRLNTEMDINGGGNSVIAYYDNVSLVIN